MHRSEPKDDSDSHLSCKSCGEFIGEDALRTLGMVLLPLNVCSGNSCI